ncbi:hypothetical protein [Streptomyces sp. NPDC051546]|uniref:phage terminase small subunit n=1 Tax=Streptomyces sp. NPDC051546 TaxID=3365655 RepID=UPI0037A2B3BF
MRRNVHAHAQALNSLAQPGRELPKALGVTTGGARRFWRTWSTAPQTVHWVETDWAELEITTKLVDAFYLGDHKVAGEIRQRTAKWGGTVEDRNRLRMTVEVDPEDNPEEGSEGPTVRDMDEELYKLLGGS